MYFVNHRMPQRAPLNRENEMRNYIDNLLCELVSTNDQMSAAERAYAELPTCNRLIQLREARSNFELALDEVIMAARAIV